MITGTAIGVIFLIDYTAGFTSLFKGLELENHDINFFQNL
jgi:hypothetical protein